MSKYMTTKEAAEKCGMKPGDLTSFVNKHGICVEKCGRAILWTGDDLMRVKRLRAALKSGCCVHCGKLWDRPEPQEGAQDAG